MMRFKIAILLTLFLSSPSISCTVNDTDINNRYTGDCRNGKAHGYGEAWGRDHYKGQFSDGQKHGNGTYTWSNNKHTFTGQYRNDTRVHGTYKYPNGDYYIGLFKNYEFNGHGNYFAADGSRYEGFWLSGKPHGKVTFRYKNSNSYVGTVKNGDRSGKGVWSRGPNEPCTEKQGYFCIIKMDGEWKNNRFLNGLITFKNGDTHAGNVLYENDGSMVIPNKTAMGRNAPTDIGQALGAFLGPNGLLGNTARSLGADGASSSGKKWGCRAWPMGHSYGFASRADARDRAMEECQKRAKFNTCRIESCD